MKNDETYFNRISLFQFSGSDPDEPKRCKAFGCAKVLNLHEQRCGDYCIQHYDNRNPYPLPPLDIPPHTTVDQRKKRVGGRQRKNPRT